MSLTAWTSLVAREITGFYREMQRARDVASTRENTQDLQCAGLTQMWDTSKLIAVRMENCACGKQMSQKIKGGLYSWFFRIYTVAPMV